MKYMGSKNRHAKHLLPIILKDREDGQWYVEPFVGGANMIDKVNGNRIGNDYNHYLISLLQALQSGWLPPKSLTESEYNHIKNNSHLYLPEVVGYAGFPCSYGAKWFGGYCRGFTDNGTTRDYIAEAYRNCTKQSEALRGITFMSKDYLSLDIPPSSIVYCDPPYMNTTDYKDSINHDEFWVWCESLIDQGHTVFVSEYNAPDGWECVWKKEVNSSLTKNTGGKKAIEKLFTK